MSPSSRELKSDILYLGQEEEVRAFEEVAALKLASYRYKRLHKKKGLVRDRSMPIKRGVIYEEAPEDLKRAGGFISLDGRINNAELALKEVIRRLEALEAEAGR